MSTSRSSRRLRSLLPAVLIGGFGCSPASDTTSVYAPLPRDHGATALAASSPHARLASAPLTPPPRIVHWGLVEEWSQPLAIMETVFWEPDDTVSLRKLLRETEAVRGRRVLEIGTGSGLVALSCLRAGAAHVVATDINPNAIECAAYNARQLKLEDRLELRQVSLTTPSAFSVVGPNERFELVISNPPWEDHTPENISEYALYDRNFALLRSLLGGLRAHLSPEGRAWLAYGNVTAIRTLLAEAPTHGFTPRLLDDRSLDGLPENFLPGLLIELIRADAATTTSEVSPEADRYIIEK